MMCCKEDSRAAHSDVIEKTAELSIVMCYREDSRAAHSDVLYRRQQGCSW